jgi:TatD DNase family protein
MFIDSHCHLDFPDFENRLPEVLETMEKQLVTKALCISVDIPDFPKVLALAKQYSHLYATVGVHPDYEDTPEPTLKWLLEEAKESKVIGIGETGLDYYRMAHKPYEELEWQRERFRVHIEASKITQKPLIIHTREASADTISILRESGQGKVNGVMHCFTESIDVAKQALDLGFYISFSGIVTFKNALQIKETCKYVPFDRMLIETDSPYLAPVPYRGKTNEPGYVSYVASYIASLKDSNVEEVGRVTSDNFYQLFNVPA